MACGKEPKTELVIFYQLTYLRLEALKSLQIAAPL
jgi:hypothetical protein